MAEESLSITEDKLTSDYVAGVKERSALKKEIEELTKEVNKYKAQAYDLTLTLESIESKKVNLKKKPVKRKVPRKKASSVISNDVTSNDVTPDDHVFQNTDTLYENIATRFPDMALSQVLFAEKRFVKADTNNNGTIDKNELEKLLDNSSLLFTKEQVMDILKEVDTDGTDTLDFFECLSILDALRAHRRTDLPQSIQQNKSSLCSIQ